MYSFKKIHLGGVKGILLDLDNTLYAYEPCHQAAINACFFAFKKIEATINLETFDNHYQMARNKIHTQIKSQAASHSRLLYFQNFFEEFYQQSKFNLTLKFENIYWNAFVKEMELFPEAKKFLKKCSLLNVPVCIITDLTAQIQIKKIQKLKIESYIKYLVSSEEAGIEKPSAKIFELALKKLNLQTKDVIMVGDNAKKDIFGAENLNIKSYLITP